MPSLAAWSEADQAFDEWVEFLAEGGDPKQPGGAEYSRSLAEQIREKPMVDILIREAFFTGYWAGQTAGEQNRHG